MSPTVTLSRIERVLDDLAYPVSKAEAVERVADVTVQYADGEEALADVVGRSNADSFASAEELESEIYSNAPTEAVGEPRQSEGEG